MASTDLTPYLNKFMEQAGILHVGVAKAMGEGIAMPEQIMIPSDRMLDPIYTKLKMAVLCTLVLSFLDQHFPELRDGSQEFRGQIAARLAFEVYRMLTNGVAIDAMRLVCGLPNPHAKGTEN